MDKKKITRYVAIVNYVKYFQKVSLSARRTTRFSNERARGHPKRDGNLITRFKHRSCLF